MKKVAIIGSTGSIGKQTLSVIKLHSDKFQVVSLAGGENSALLLEQVKEFKPKIATLKNSIDNLPSGVEFYFGEDAYLNAIVEEADIVVVALVGYSGIHAVLRAIELGKTIALANKESLVVAGGLVTERAREKGVKILPVDSEHSAIWQALSLDFNTPFNKIILTASGGAFRDYTIEQLKKVTVLDALKHPNWLMGKKITVDCATMVNKAFEVIEAKWLYSAPFEKIDVVIHRESIVHSLVEFVDRSVIAQMGVPSMELPIQLALSYPNRINSNVQGLDLVKLGKLTFEQVDENKYPCFKLVVDSAKQGGILPAVVNGANDRAVDLFIKGIISYNDIYKAIDNAVNKIANKALNTEQDFILANSLAVESVNKLFGVKC